MDFDRAPEIAKYLSLLFFVYFIGANTVWLFLPIFFEQQISSIFLVGVLTSLFPLVPVLIDIPVGNLVQRAGSKSVIFTGFALGVLPPILYLTASPLFLVMGKIFEGFNKSMIWSGGWCVSMKQSSEDSEAESLSIFMLGFHLAAVLGPVLGGFLILSYGFDLVFLIWAFTSLLTLGVYQLYIGLEGKKPFINSLDDIFHKKTYSDDIKHLKNNWGGLKLPLTLVTLNSVVYAFFWLAIPLTLEEMNVNFALMGLIFGLAALPRIFQFAFGEFADRVGDIESIMIFSVLTVPLLISLGFVSNWILFAALYFVAMALVSGISPATHSLYDKNVPDKLEGEMTGFLEMFKHSGQAFGPFMAGTMASLYGLHTSFWAASIFSLLLVIITFRHI